MNMQDKEIDQLFRSEFEDFETEPSTKVWGNVTRELDTVKRRNTWLPYLSMAASILLVVALGWYFIPRDNTKTKKQDQIAKAPNNKPAKAIIAPAKDITPGTEQIPMITNRVAYKAVTPRTMKQVARPIIEEDSMVQKAAEIKPAEQLAQNVQRNPEITTPVVPGIETALTARAEVSGEPAFTTRQPVAAAQDPKTNKVLAAMPVKKHRINTFGDLINVVVSKVDKRKDKIIEFSSTDEDESTISAVNLGFVKIKKQD
ncbi:BatA domain-containing protein [Mucilaginibacter glaciei]|uniref:Uncharacterized protein n=1 Tax=Mucilaginibacter glaciei TaxID=2772109 RepID=A0A926NQ21_9SPHI|nr:BatA domain-containing protein [Mucilaginibacter glaciei]MBD1392587.1 hypothetical protein [Mucilaginibacter glaciei]